MARSTRETWSNRGTMEGAPIVALACTARCNQATVSVARVNADRRSQGVRFEQLPAGSMEPAGGAHEDDEGRQRSATRKTRAAPADEARVVRHSTRREARTPALLTRGYGGRRESEDAVGWVSQGSIEAGRCE